MDWISAFIAAAMYSQFGLVAIPVLFIILVVQSLFSPIGTLLTVLNLLCLLVLGLIALFQNYMEKTVYALVSKTLLLFMVNTIRGAVVHRLIHEVRANLLRYSPRAD